MAEEKEKPKRKRAPAKKKPAAKKRAPVGRPPKEVTKAMIARVRQLASQGCSKKTIAGCLGMSITTYCERQKENPELTKAFDEGRTQGVAAISGALFTKALNGDTHAIRYWLNNMEPEEWQERRTVEAGDNLAKSLQSMRPEDRLELLNQQEQTA